MTVTTDFFGKHHTVMPCRAEDVDVHFAKIQDIIPGEEVIQFKQRMSECITAGSAYTLSDGSCFLYYLNYQPCCANGIALYGKNSPMKMLALLAGIFTDLDLHTFKLDLYLHAKVQVKEYKNLVTETSIKRQLIKGYPLVVRIDKLVSKINAIYKKRGIKCAIQ